MNLLTSELMQAAAVLLEHGERLDVVFHKSETRKYKCYLAGYGERDGTAQLAVWYRVDDLKSAGIAFGRIEVPFLTLHRLQSIICSQEKERVVAGRMTHFLAIAQARRLSQQTAAVK